MGHLSLYRKYRPQAFEDVVGQSHVTQTLRNAIGEGRIAHAFLFSGPRGTGKTSTARILAKALNCAKREASGSTEPCNDCPSCLAVTEGSALDVVEIDAASHGSVEDARELRERVAYAPVSGKSKVYIIDECHMLSPAANNALLKILEEPPSHAIFVFATTEPHKVLQTLLDRCQRYDFRAVGPEAISARLAEICSREGVTVEQDVLSIISARAAGSVRDSLSLLEQLISFAGSSVRAADVARLLGSVPEDDLFQAVDLVADGDVGACLIFTDRLIRSGRDLREFVQALSEHLRRLFIVQNASGGDKILDVSGDQAQRLEAQAGRFGHAGLLRLLDLASETALAIRQPIDGRLVLEAAIARMARPDMHASGAALLARIERLERLAGIQAEAGAQTQPERGSRPPQPAPQRKPPPQPAKAAGPPPASADPAPAAPSKPEPQPEPAAPSGPPPAAPSGPPPGPGAVIDLEVVRRSWDLVLEKLKKRRIGTRALLNEATPSAWNEGELVLEFGPRFRYHRDQIATPANSGLLAEAFFEVLGVRPSIRCVVGAAAEAVADGRDQVRSAPSGGTPDAAADGGADPVSMIREGFGAEVVDEF